MQDIQQRLRSPVVPCSPPVNVLHAADAMRPTASPLGSRSFSLLLPNCPPFMAYKSAKAAAAKPAAPIAESNPRCPAAPEVLAGFAEEEEAEEEPAVELVVDLILAPLVGEVDTAEAAVLVLLGLVVTEELVDVDETIVLFEIAEPVGVAEHPAACGRVTWATAQIWLAKLIVAF